MLICSHKRLTISLVCQLFLRLVSAQNDYFKNQMEQAEQFLAKDNVAKSFEIADNLFKQAEATQTNLYSLKKFLFCFCI